ncbi:hypothetical protein [Nocardia tengchongensis]|uniref:hypothetical protein n=1 Tax=Nocardia tengchongensis TaxID=2055889 RepID=UPI0036B92198
MSVDQNSPSIYVPEGLTAPTAEALEAAARARKQLEQMSTRNGKPEVWAESKWWGFHVYLNKPALDLGLELAPLFVDMLCEFLPSAVSTVVGHYMMVYLEVVKHVDRGYGVKLTSPWIMWTALVPTALNAPVDRNLYWTVFEPDQWSPSEQFQENFTTSNPALAEFRGDLYAAHVGGGDEYCWWIRYDREHGWGPSIKIEGARSSTGPALAAFQDRLHMVHRARTDNMLWHTSFDGTRWQPSVPLGTNSTSSPALAVFQNQLVLVHKGADSSMWYLRYDGSKWFDGKQIPGAYTITYPALAVFGNELHCVQVGTEDVRDLWHMRFNGNTWHSNTRLYEKRSDRGVALAVYKNHLYCAARGSGNQNLWWTRYNGSSWGPYIRFNSNNNSGHGPALIHYRDSNSTSDQLMCLHRGTGSKGVGLSLDQPDHAEEPAPADTPPAD